MKILHVEGGKHYYGGARQVAYLIEGLAAQGVDNILACPTGAEIARAPSLVAMPRSTSAGRPSWQG